MSVTKVAVLGATGQQGGSVAAALAEKGIDVVAITRNTESDAAKKLAERPHTTVRKGDLNDYDSLVAAFEGCDGAFVVANFWEGMNASKEMEQYENAAKVLKKVGGMKHIVYSTLEETVVPGVTDDFTVLEEHETGKMYVPHFDGKARAQKYYDGLPVTFVTTSCYFENFTSFFSFYKAEDGSYTLTLPLGDKKIPWTILPDLGVYVASIFNHPELIGKNVGQASFLASGDDIAEMVGKATGKTIKYNQVDWKVFASFGFPGAEELAQMFEFWLRTYDDFVALRDLDAQEKIMGCKMTDPSEYIQTFKDKIKLEG